MAMVLALLICWLVSNINSCVLIKDKSWLEIHILLRLNTLLWYFPFYTAETKIFSQIFIGSILKLETLRDYFMAKEVWLRVIKILV